jgi:hypothetical protein
VTVNLKRKCSRYLGRSEELSTTQNGFRKEKCTRDCLPFLTTDINNSFEMKEQTVAALLDISGAYDNVILDILSEIMVEQELPIHIIHLLWNLLEKKKYKDLPQGSVLPSFL